MMETTDTALFCTVIRYILTGGFMLSLILAAVEMFTTQIIFKACPRGVVRIVNCIGMFVLEVFSYGYVAITQIETTENFNQYLIGMMILTATLMILSVYQLRNMKLRLQSGW